MEVILAGYNVDGDLLERLRETIDSSIGPEIDPESVTPETLSAAYARISRDPRPIPELRAEARADVARARRSNRRIIFGFGHASVAEHAVFNFDILGLSRLAVEALEACRLGSYTEKSQRYILLERDFIVPPEVTGTPREIEFRELLEAQQDGYRRAYDVLAEHYRKTHPDEWSDPKTRGPLDGAAKEDARYFLGLATTGQLGATLNARSLEATVRRLRAHPLLEVRELGSRLHKAVSGIAPSLIRHTEPPPCRDETPQALRALAQKLLSGKSADGGPGSDMILGAQLADDNPSNAGPSDPVRLVDTSADGDVQLLTALVHSHSESSWHDARALVDRLGDRERREIVSESLRRHEAHDPPLREFELPEFTFELTLSASCFAQLKRHRMATLLTQTYDPRLGVTLPAVFSRVGLGDAFDEVRRRSEAMHAKLREAARAMSRDIAAYALTNAHRRRVLFKVNARELYHFSRLRLDEHAQWDIRTLAGEMISQARERMPLVMLLAAGKDRFEQMRATTLET
jgi:flavin-dependent thymidylate synthase